MLYKYFDSKTLQPVEEQTLKFAKVDDLNDPFENLYRIIPAKDRLEKDLRDVAVKFNIAEQDIAPLRKSVDGSSHDIHTTMLQIDNQLKENDRFGILSLTRNSKNSLMWSHYAEKHSGYVIGFDEDSSWFKDKVVDGAFMGIPTKVSYKGKRVAYSEVRALDEESVAQSFFVKSDDWEYEREIRMVMPIAVCRKINKNLHVLDYPQSMIKEIIFGYRCSDTVRLKIMKALDGCDVEFKCALPSSVSYDVEVCSTDEMAHSKKLYQQIKDE